MTKRIVIIGGGIAGLAAAYRLQETINAGAGDIDCTVLEGTGHWGGKIHTVHKDGFILERGPDSFISQKPWAIELCKKIGLGDQLTGTKTDHPKTFIYLNKKLLTLPDGLSLMVPTKFMPFITTRMFSWPGKIRMGLDLLLPKRRGNGDESLASFVRRRLGEEAVQRLAQPMMAGIFASDPEKMSLHATFPMFAQIEKKYRSLILGMLAAKRKQATAPKPKSGYTPFSMFVTLKNGLSEMVERLMERSPNITFRNNARVQDLRPEGDGWRVELESGDVLTADAVMVATPANVSAQMVKPFAQGLADELAEIKYVSTAAVSMGFKKEEFGHSLRGFGFVVPVVEGRKISACTWVSSKFPGRAPEGHVLLRAFVGGALNEPLAEQSEEELVQMVRSELADLMGVHAEPLFARVFQYKKGNVQYGVHHQKRVESLNREQKKFPGLFLAGSAYTGIGIPDCVNNGNHVADALLEYLREKVPVE